jgi:cytochrome c
MQLLIGLLSRRAPLICVAGLIALAGCSEDQEPDKLLALGDPDTGKELIVEYGCGSCHQIPGIPDAIGVTAPPLDKMGERKYIAGKLRNTPSNLTRWLQDPQEVEPGTVMPDMGLSEAQASDIAAYLYTLE